jgi:hypothetical protein
VKKLLQVVLNWLKVNGWDLVTALALVVCLVILGASVKQGVSVQPPTRGEKGTSGSLKAIVGEQAIIAALEKSMSDGATIYVGLPRLSEYRIYRSESDYYRSDPLEPESELVKRLEWIDAAMKNVKSGAKPTIIAPSAHAIYIFLTEEGRMRQETAYPAEYQAKLQALRSKTTVTVKDIVTRSGTHNCGLMIQGATSIIVPAACTSSSIDAYIGFYYGGILQKATTDLQNNDPEIKAAQAKFNQELADYKATPRRNPDDYQTFNYYARRLIDQEASMLIYIDTNDPYIMHQFQVEQSGTQD